MFLQLNINFTFYYSMMLKNNISFLVLAIAIFCFSSCEETPVSPTEEGDLVNITYNPTPYKIDYPITFPQMPIPEDNPTTFEGIDLGRHLFYDNILSGNNTMSCSSCHDPKKAFTDGQSVSKGIDGISGRRSSMSLINVAFSKRGLFWDGRAKTLEDQALLPVTDEIELHTTWGEVEDRLKKHNKYPELFRKAFGIKDRSEIKKDLAAKAIAQFERILISGGNSKYDQYLRGEADFSDLEFLGYLLYSDINQVDNIPDAQCAHCHQLDIATSDDFLNNGIQESSTLDGFKDLGRGGFTLETADNGKMKTPTLRNIELTAPYMHDGSLVTLEDVLNHYQSGGKVSKNKDALMSDININEHQKKAIIAFLKTLTDTSYLKNPLVLKP